MIFHIFKLKEILEMKITVLTNKKVLIKEKLCPTRNKKVK